MALTLILALLILLVSSIGDAQAPWVFIDGDTGDVNVVVNYWPGTDKYGRPSINPDGSFYPNDQFWVKYKVYVKPGLKFAGVQIHYDASALEIVKEQGWGSDSGLALFRVKPNASPGLYTIIVRAKAIREIIGSGGTIRVTKGGADVTAFYDVIVIEHPPPVNETETPENQTATMRVRYAMSSSAYDAIPIIVAAAAATAPKLEVRSLGWTTWFDIFRGTVCGARGILYDSGGRPVANSDIVVEFKKRNLWTGAEWIVQKRVKTSGNGYFVAEDTCNPLTEAFIGVQAWAEKPGYLPSWSLLVDVDPASARVEQGRSFLVGVRVHLIGRYTAVPVSLSVEGAPSGCETVFEIRSGEVNGSSPLQTVLMLNVDPSTPTGKYSVTIVASSDSKAASAAAFSLEVIEPVIIYSSVSFIAYGLGSDAIGTALTIDGSINLESRNLPHIEYWQVNTLHSYSWASSLDSELSNENVTIYYVLRSARAVENYIADAAITINVVEYDPRFTYMVYTIPKSPGESSFEKHFAVIIRYDGNGPEGKLDQRAVFEGWRWDGWASRVSPQQEAVGLAGVPSLVNIKPEDASSLMKELQQLFNLTSGVTFSATGIDEDTDGVILKVDDEQLTYYMLPKTYKWPVNTTHTYEWSTRMPVYKLIMGPGGAYYMSASDEWFSLEYVQVTFPQLGVNATGKDVMQLAEQFTGQLMAKLRSPSGKITVTGLGNKVVAAYSHNKYLRSIAGSAGVGASDALKLLNAQFPVYFNNESRYAKFIFDLDDMVAQEAHRQLFNSSITYVISFTSDMFRSHAYNVNYTCPLEYYKKMVNATAFKWNPTDEKWDIDHDVMVETIFDVSFNTTEAEWFMGDVKEKGADEIMLRMAEEDVYDCHQQYFGGRGSAIGMMLRTSAFYYNLNATAGWGAYVTGSLPQPSDAWTEEVETKEAWWGSPTSNTTKDTGRKAAGSASIKVEEKKAPTASAILTLLRPIESLPQSRLAFKIFLGEGFNGKINVYIEGEQTVNYTATVPVGRWVVVSVSGLPNKARRVGIYAELQSEGGAFWVDDLVFSTVSVWAWDKKTTVEKTVYVNFASDEPFLVYVNLDPSSPLPVNVTADDAQFCRLNVTATPELGGLTSITVYHVLDAPPALNFRNPPVDGLQLKKILTFNLTAPEHRLAEMNFSGYQGYTAIHGGVLGYSGNYEINLSKTPEMEALPNYNATLLLIEAENVWGTKFRAIVAVKPWAKPPLQIMFEQVAYVLLAIAVAAVIIGLIIRFCRESLGKG
ncbi:MAG: hypothetical protein QXO15_00300 [Nitrososphaerota archaeon]